MKNKGSFSIIRLNQFCLENNIELLGNYDYVTRDTIITGLCKMDNCKKSFMKNFRTLINNTSFYCDLCMSKIKVDKRKETHLKNCGFTTNLKCPITKEKIKQTNLIKYGCEHNSQSEEIKNKKKITLLKNYGVEYPTQSEIIKQKSKETSIKNYGTEHPSQNAEYSEKHSKNSYNKKEYILPSGKIINIQGFEKFALDFLLKNENINENDIITSRKLVPEIWYYDEFNKKHRHYVDIFIPTLNKCIEIKSKWTAEKKKDCIFLKQIAAKELGYEYEIWVYDGKGIMLDKYI
jgi:hypothetical protein